MISPAAAAVPDSVNVIVVETVWEAVELYVTVFVFEVWSVHV